MKRGLLIEMLSVLSMLLIGDAWANAPGSSFGNEVTEAERQLVVSKLSSMPLSFTENRGQFGEKTKFRCNALGASFYFAVGEVAYLFSRETDEVIEEPMGPLADMPDKLSRPCYKKEGLLVRAKFVGANPNAEVIGEGMLPHRSNYFYGNDPSKWCTDVPNYSGVRYENIYPGIDLKYYGDGHSLKYDFIVQPGADPSQIEIEYDGVNSLSVNGDGELVVATQFGDVVERVPYAYQEIDGERGQVPCRYVILERDRFGFALDNDYDRSQPLYIDPELFYSTYLGGNDDDWGMSIAVDGKGNAYVTGTTKSWDFPTVNPYDGSFNSGSDVIVTKLSASGDSLIYSTYLGGWNTDNGTGVAVDGEGNAYVTGRTFSTNFPIVNPYDGSYNGGGDAFVTKLSASGSSLVYSTYLGGNNDDDYMGIAVNGEGNAYVTGTTYSTNFPIVNPYDGSLDGECDAFVTKLSASGSSLIYSTYLGGSDLDGGNAIAVDGEGCAYVTGETFSTNFPIVNPYDGSLNGWCDVFVTKLSASGSSLLYSTYLGGSDDDRGNGIAVDGEGCAYATGGTKSWDFPTVNPYDGSFNSGSDVFVTRLSASGDSLIYSTYLGGSSVDASANIVVDGEGNAYVTGITMSTDFPMANPYDGSHNGYIDVFVAKLSRSGGSLIYSTYLGGSDWDWGKGIVVDGEGCAYVVGETKSTDFPTVNPYQSGYGGGLRDAFVAKFGTEEQITLTSPNGGEVWIDSCSYDITWSSTGSGIDHIRLLLSTDCGSTYPDTIVGSTPNTGSYTWTVPLLISSTVRVKAQAEDADDSVLAWDESDTIFTTTLKGDVNSDCEINILDIMRKVNIILGLGDPPTEHELWAGDDNCDGGINILDIITEVNCILYDGEDCLFCIDKFAKATTEEESEAAIVSLDVAGSLAGQALVPIGIETKVPVTGVQLALDYSPDEITIGEVQLTERSKGLTLAWKAKSGELTILLYSLTGKTIKPGNGPIVEIPIEAASNQGSDSRLKLKEVILADEEGHSIPTRIREAQPSTPLPKEYTLSQNYPNPFNSETVIRYSLIVDRNQSAAISLKIYNIEGQLVRTLIDGQQEAGYHSVRWDSRDQAGKDVASGIYFYRIKAGKFTDTKKMVLMR